jgi:hypothetical protein
VSEEKRFLTIVTADPTARAVLERAPALGVGDWWLTAGVLFQTVRNELTERPVGAGIRDADLFYFDEDTSWDAEDAVIRAGAELFGDLPVPVEIRNEARVHLWYADRFGVPAVPFLDCADAIDHFAAVCCCFGATVDAAGALQVCAPHGYDDLFSLVDRPNRRLAPAVRLRGQDGPVGAAMARTHRAALGRRRQILNDNRPQLRPAGVRTG